MTIRTGDILFYKPRNIGKLIAWWTGSQYIHCGIALIKNGVPFVLDFSFWSAGFRENVLAVDLPAYAGLIDVFRCNYAIDSATVVEEMRRLQDRKYSIPMALHMGINRLCHKGCIENDLDIPSPDEGLDCSAAVALAFQNAGIDLCPKLSIRHTTPGRLAESIALERKFTLTQIESCSTS